MEGQHPLFRLPISSLDFLAKSGRAGGHAFVRFAQLALLFSKWRFLPFSATPVLHGIFDADGVAPPPRKGESSCNTVEQCWRLFEGIVKEQSLVGEGTTQLVRGVGLLSEHIVQGAGGGGGHLQMDK